jgi:hypothetical protein
VFGSPPVIVAVQVRVVLVVAYCGVGVMERLGCTQQWPYLRTALVFRTRG